MEQAHAWCQSPQDIRDGILPVRPAHRTRGAIGFDLAGDLSIDRANAAPKLSVTAETAAKGSDAAQPKTCMLGQGWQSACPEPTLGGGTAAS